MRFSIDMFRLRRQSAIRNPQSEIARHSCKNKPSQNQVPLRFTAGGASSGDHTGKETPVPIPNTAVKLSGPMIVPTSAKVGIARFYFAALLPNPADSKEPCGVFVCAG